MALYLTENVKLRITADMLEALKRLANEGDRTVAAEMRRALRRHIQASEEPEPEEAVA
jgi:Ribbon-helix-helix protein, copG family